MLKLIKITTFASLSFALTACGWLTGDDGLFRDRSNDYRQASETKALQLPAAVASDVLDDSYDIPTISDRSTLKGEFEMPRPEPLGDEVLREAVKINRLGDTQWVLINGTPGQVWPRLRAFFTLTRMGLLRVDAVNGLLETAWLQPTEKGLPRERYRLRIDQGVQRESTELYVTQMTEQAGDQWPAASTNRQREDAFVQSLAQFLADASVDGSISMLAQQAIESSGRVSIEQAPNQLPRIALALPFHRAWASLRLAIEKSSLTFEDVDVGQQLYYVRYLAPVKEEGWFSGWFSKKSEDRGESFLLRVISLDQQHVEIAVEKPDGKTITEEEVSAILKVIKRHLS